MNTAWLKTRQTKYGAYVSAYILIILAVLGLANWLANRYNKSFDSTSNKKFSLSDQTEKVVKGLKQPATITYFDETRKFDAARDLLDRYHNLSSKLNVVYVDPDKKPQLARAAGIRTLGTIFVEIGNRKQEAKSLTEEEITGAFIRALKGGERTLCVVSGSGEHSLDEAGRDGYSSLKDVVEKNNYKTKSISLLDKPEVPKECTVVLVAGPKFDYVPPVVSALKTYVEGGGRALFFLDPPLKLGRQDIAENGALVSTLAGWGVTADNDLVIDTSGIGQIFGLSEAVPLVSGYQSHAIVKEMKGIATAFPLARSLDAKSGGKATAEKLFSTSGNSFATTNLSSPEVKPNPAKDKQGPLALAVAGTYSTGTGSGQGRFVVVGSSGWAANSILRFNGNRDLFLNMMNWLSSDEDLISIRPKEPEDRRLTLSSRQMNVVFYSSVIFLPLLVVAAGLGVWWRRR